MSDLSSLSFDQLLARYFDRDDVEAELVRRFGVVTAVLVVGFTGTVARTQRYGAGHALALAAAGKRVMEPAFAARGGTHVREAPHGALLTFDTPDRALLAALDAMAALRAFDATRPRRGHDHLHGRVGLGFGDALRLPGELAGPDVERARALVEAAKGGELLVTEAFLAAHGPLPAGVGAFRAPAEREQAAGFGFHVVADYR